ncbi:MAG: DUF488 domain-containing protein [Thermoanaerobaculum sp.]
MVIGYKRVYEPASPEDGTRVLVDRLWPRGFTKERLAALWWPELAPSPELRKWYNHEPQRWDEFRARYTAELCFRREAVMKLLALAQKGPVTLLTATREVERSAAVVLRDHLLDLERQVR